MTNPTDGSASTSEQRAQASHQSQTIGAIGSMFNTLTEPNPYDSYDAQKRDATISSIGSMTAQGASVGTMFGGPIGTGVGAALGFVGGLFLSSKKRKAIEAQKRAEHERKVRAWQKQLNAYKDALKKTEAQTAKATVETTKIKSQLTQQKPFQDALARANREEAQKALLSPSIEDTVTKDDTQKERISALARVDRQANIEQTRLTKLDQLDTLLEKERTANRSLFQIKTEHAEEIEDVTRQLQEIG